MKYHPNVHDLPYVIRDLDTRVDKLERGLLDFARNPGTPHAVAQRLLELLDQEESSDWTPEDGNYPKSGERGDILS